MAKTILINGYIYTDCLCGQPRQALVIEDGTVVAVGRTANMLDYRERRTRIIDLKHKTVLPAFADCHVHFLAYGLRAASIDLDGMPSLERIVERIRKRTAGIRHRHWVVGGGWNKNVWPQGEMPHRTVLDRACPRNPAAFYSKDGHMLWLNSLGLKLAGISRDTADVEGGEIERDADGDPTGVLKENAISIAEPYISKPDRAEKLAAIQSAVRRAHSKGVVSIHDFEDDEEALSIWQQLLLDGKLKLRVCKMIPHKFMDEAIGLGLSTGFGNQLLRTGAIKIYADGALGSQTALMFRPYVGSNDNYGIAVTAKEELSRLIGRCIDSNLAVAIHAIGDKANADIISIIGRHKKKSKRRRLRHRIEHVQLIRRQDIARLPLHDIIASVQPAHVLADRDVADRYWGKRAANAYPFAAFVESGVRVCFGSDAPIDELDPIKGIAAAVNRCSEADARGPWYPEQRISVAQAAHAHTHGAAYASGEEHVKGKLEPGFLADLVVLDKDIFQVRPEELYGVQVLGTLFDGKWVYRKRNSGIDW